MKIFVYWCAGRSASACAIIAQIKKNSKGRIMPSRIRYSVSISASGPECETLLPFPSPPPPVNPQIIFQPLQPMAKQV